MTAGAAGGPLVTRARRGLAWGLAVLVTLLVPQAAGGPAIKDLLERLNVSGYSLDEKPPDFSAATPDGRTMSLAALRGKVVLVSFWATWCPPCREEMPAFERLHRDFAAQGLTVLGVNARESASTVQRYGEELGLTFLLLLDPNGTIHKDYGVIGLPTTFLIGRDGRAVGRAVGARDWGTARARRLVEALLAESAARPETRPLSR